VYSQSLTEGPFRQTLVTVGSEDDFRLEGEIMTPPFYLEEPRLARNFLRAHPPCENRFASISVMFLQLSSEVDHSESEREIQITLPIEARIF